MITEDDDCYFLVSFSRGDTQDLQPWNRAVRALKLREPLSPDNLTLQINAIHAFSAELRAQLPKDWLRRTFVPTPSSRIPDHPEYENRASRVLREVCSTLDVRFLVHQSVSTSVTHLMDRRFTIEQLVAIYSISIDQMEPAPEHIVVVDDIVATGLHYRAMVHLLRNAFPRVPISGLFLARRAHELDE